MNSDSYHSGMYQNTTKEVGVKESEKKGRRRGKDNEIKGGPPRDKNTGDYLPDSAAEGSAHTTIGSRESDRGPYTQGATFDQEGKFRGRTDVTDHGRRDLLILIITPLQDQIVLNQGLILFQM